MLNGPGLAQHGPRTGPSVVSLASMDAKLEDARALLDGRLDTACHF